MSNAETARNNRSSRPNASLVRHAGVEGSIKRGSREKRDLNAQESHKNAAKADKKSEAAAGGEPAPLRKGSFLLVAL